MNPHQLLNATTLHQIFLFHATHYANAKINNFPSSLRFIDVNKKLQHEKANISTGWKMTRAFTPGTVQGIAWQAGILDMDVVSRQIWCMVFVAVVKCSVIGRNSSGQRYALIKCVCLSISQLIAAALWFIKRIPCKNSMKSL